MAFLTTFLPSPVTWASESYKSSCWCCSNRKAVVDGKRRKGSPQFIKQSNIFEKSSHLKGANMNLTIKNICLMVVPHAKKRLDYDAFDSFFRNLIEEVGLLFRSFVGCFGNTFQDTAGQWVTWMFTFIEQNEMRESCDWCLWKKKSDKGDGKTFSVLHAPPDCRIISILNQTPTSSHHPVCKRNRKMPGHPKIDSVIL